jgi:hypothetical protein
MVGRIVWQGFYAREDVGRAGRYEKAAVVVLRYYRFLVWIVTLAPC